MIERGIGTIALVISPPFVFLPCVAVLTACLLFLVVLRALFATFSAPVFAAFAIRLCTTGRVTLHSNSLSAHRFISY